MNPVNYDRSTEKEKRNYNKKKKENMKAIVDIAAEAKKHGMSYGQYVVKMGL